MDDGSLVIESLDSLWFFTNVLSSRTRQLGPVCDDHTIIKEEPTKTMSPILEKKQTESPISEILDPIRRPKCGDFADHEIEAHIVLQPAVLFEMEGIESSEARETNEEKRKKRRSLDQRRKILGELDLGGDFHGEMENYGSNWLLFGGKETFGYQKFAGPQNYQMKMPPLSDGMAMKEHLKSWAHAVAGTQIKKNLQGGHLLSLFLIS